MRHVHVGTLLLALLASVGCAAREPVFVPPPTAGSPEEDVPPAAEVVAPPSDEDLPKYGEFVYVEVLPEVIHKEAPRYPSIAREAGVSGTVIIQALVGRDGLVKDTRVVRSIPMLDAAATASVRQWVFKPAQARGQPVAVWVAAPVKFTLQ
jgi:TonB family protein